MGGSALAWIPASFAVLFYGIRIWMTRRTTRLQAESPYSGVAWCRLLPSSSGLSKARLPVACLPEACLP